MIIMRHPGSFGWEFSATKVNIQGGGRTLKSRMEASEHAARNYLTRAQGRPVLHEDACAQVRHAVNCAGPAV